VLPDDPEDLDPGLARERTKLAWARTAIAFAAVGVGALRAEPIIGLIVLAVAPVVWALGRFASQRVAPERLSRRLLLVTATITAVALLALAAAVLSHGPASLDQLLRRHG
jgi:uncharacterized membrane protein YidH (DUF202 family)